MTEVFLIRHGETDWNRERRYQGQLDVPLNNNGILQARKMAEQMSQHQLEQIYSSDLGRAYQTAEILAAAAETPLQPDERLREIHQGDWQGLRLQEIQDRYPQQLQTFHDYPAGPTPTGGESITAVQKRMLAAFNTYMRAHPRGAFALISHGLAIATLRVYLEGQSLDQVWNYIPPNAEPLHIQMENWNQ